MSFSDYIVDNVTSEVKETSDGNQIRINCPFCTEYSNDLKLYIGSKHPELWFCFRCKNSGNPNKFIQMYEGVNYQDAKNTLELYGVEDKPMSKLAEKYGEDLDPQEYLYMMTMGLHEMRDEDEEVCKKPPKFLQGYLPLSQDFTPRAEPLRQYLYSRGVSEYQIDRHCIGYVVDGHMTTLTGTQVPIKNHVVFLTYNDRGEYVYWNTRSIDPNNFIKTFNAPSGEGEYGKADVIFNLNNAKNQDNIILCEGVFDALTFSDNGIATFGKKVSKEQVRLLEENLIPEQKLYIFLDTDAIDESIELAEVLRRDNTYIVVNPTDLDPSDLGTKRALDILKNHTVTADGRGSILAKLNTI